MLRRPEIPSANSTLHLAYSFACNLSCDHCIFRCGPESRQTMGIPRARAFLEQAREAGIRKVVFTGGEPFLYPGELRTLIQCAAGHGMRAGTITNAAWASSRKKAKDTLVELRGAGLGSITLSTDRYHLRAVPLENVKHVLAAAEEIGLQTGVKISRLAHDPVAEGLYRGLQGWAAKIRVQEISPLGRGASLRSGLPRRASSSFLRPGCVSPAVLVPDGHLLTCCNLPAQDVGPGDFPLVLGNAANDPLRGLLRKRSADPVLTALRDRGPSFLLALLADEAPGLGPQREARYQSGCDLCFHLFRRLHDTRPLYAALRREGMRTVEILGENQLLHH
jgi:hypothetical protein